MNTNELHALVTKIAVETYLPRLQMDWAAHQPAGSCGFRKGDWSVLFDGKPIRIYSCVPHSADLEVQASEVLMDAARGLAWRDVGQAYPNLEREWQ